MDIIIFAAIALFIFFKLREQLGKVDEDQKRDAIRKFIKEQTESKKANNGQNSKVNNVVSIDGSKVNNQDISKEIDSESQEILNKVNLNIRNDLTKTLNKANISAVDFVKGATIAFEMIIESFAKGDQETLKNLLSPQIYQQFVVAIKDRQKNGQNLNTQIISVDLNEILAAKIVKNYALITVKISSKQINYTSDSKNEIISGSKENIDEISDIWTFKKDCNSSSPNWFVSSTS